MFPHWALSLYYLYGFFGQSGISSTKWKEQPEFFKGFPHWAIFFLKSGFFGQSVISYTNWKEQLEFYKGLPHQYLLFFGFFGQRDWVSTRQAGVWIDFHFSDFFILFKCFCQTQFQSSELWNIPQFQCCNISETPSTMWDSLKPDWNVILIVWLRSKINTVDVNRIESKCFCLIKSKPQLSQIKSKDNWIGSSLKWLPAQNCGCQWWR